jgi:hypothetical protein
MKIVILDALHLRRIKNNKISLSVTSRQLSNAGGFQRLTVTKPTIDKGEEKKQQVNPSLRLQAGR